MRAIRGKVLTLMIIAAAMNDASARPEKAENVVPSAPARVEEIDSVPWIEVIEKEIPPLQNKLGDRWPMIAWHSVGMEPLAREQIEMLLDRGLIQHLRMEKRYIEAAKALQEAGAPVIFMQGEAGSWPYSLAADSSRWAHQFDEGYHYEMAGRGGLGAWHGACPMMLEGWELMAAEVRTTLEAFRAAGVRVDAVWMDWEGDPYPWAHLFKQLAHCQRCRAQLPPQVIEDESQFWAFYWRLYQQLYGAYLAGPVREIFPQCSVTNWHLVYSTQTTPLSYFVNNRVLPPGIPPLFTATNPVAYGNDKFWYSEWKEEYPRDRRHVDQFYMHNLLRQISGDAANRQAYAPEVGSFPWVVRWCRITDSGEDEVPDMSREAYRESLRHMWLRGIDGMQVFNAYLKDYAEISLFELQDALAIYNEILAHREFLAAGEPMNLQVPGPQDEGVLWSGLRLQERALVRLVSQGDTDVRAELEPWAGSPIELEAPRGGKTYVLRLVDGRVEALE